MNIIKNEGKIPKIKSFIEFYQKNKHREHWKGNVYINYDSVGLFNFCIIGLFDKFFFLVYWIENFNKVYIQNSCRNNKSIGSQLDNSVDNDTADILSSYKKIHRGG